MPRNEEVPVGASPVQLTANDVEGLFVYNYGPGSIRLAGSASASAPAMVGPVLEAGYALSAAVALADIWPGVAGVVRVFAQATEPSGATVFVSHA